MRIGEIFRYPKIKDRKKEKIDGFSNFSFHTDFTSENLVLLESGINPIGIVKNNGVVRTPAILTRSSPHKIGSSETPWQDIYNVSKGHIRYFGDNKSSGKPENKSGNKALLDQFELHNSSDPEIRKKACPIIFFKSVPVNNKVKGYLEFNGFGVITNVERIVQYNRKTKSDFVNYSFDFAVLDISLENEKFNWEWINLRRNKTKSIEDTLTSAPISWKKWIVKGNSSIETVRRNVSKLQVLSTSEQKPETSSKEFKTLQEIYDLNFRHLELSIREIGYGDQSINKKMKDYVNLFHQILSDLHLWKELDKIKKVKILSNFLRNFKNIEYLTIYFDDFRENLLKKTLNSYIKSVSNA